MPRGQNPNSKKNLITGGTKKRKFDSAESFLREWRKYNDEIIEGGFLDLPTVTGFCDWLAKNYKEVNRDTIYATLNRYSDIIKKEFEDIRSDTMARGASVGRYNPTTIIFALKNWCKWTDRQETTANVEVHGSIEDLMGELDG